MTRHLCTLLLFLSLQSITASHLQRTATPAIPTTEIDLTKVIHCPQDSIRVEELLRKGRANSTSPITLFFANQLKGLPYVAHTLETDGDETLVVNLREMDCTTLVENVLALTLTTQQGSTRFGDFCKHLRKIRYRGGVLTDYTSRNHYYSQWIRSNEQLGVVQEICPANKNTGISGNTPFKAKQTIDLHYMSQHVQSYKMLRSAPASQQQKIRQYEEEVNGTIVSYIPTSMLNRGQKTLSCVHDGDVLALVTSKDGLDVSHLGFAVWGKDDRLHLLNASSIHHKVVLENMTLYQYMCKQKHRLGIRVIRLTR